MVTDSANRFEVTENSIVAHPFHSVILHHAKAQSHHFCDKCYGKEGFRVNLEPFSLVSNVDRAFSIKVERSNHVARKLHNSLG